MRIFLFPYTMPWRLCTLCADITNGLTGQTLNIGLGTPDNLMLAGNAFPVIIAQDGVGIMMAAARVAAAGGGIIAFNKESYMTQCGSEASPAAAMSCRLAVNALRWAAGVPATNKTAFRVAVSANAVNSQQIGAIKTAAVSAHSLPYCT
jgi:hypothetical protein